MTTQNNPLTTQITPHPEISSHIPDFPPVNPLEPTQPKISPQIPKPTPSPTNYPENPSDIPNLTKTP